MARANIINFNLFASQEFFQHYSALADSSLSVSFRGQSVPYLKIFQKVRFRFHFDANYPQIVLQDTAKLKNVSHTCEASYSNLFTTDKWWNFENFRFYSRAVRRVHIWLLERNVVLGCGWVLPELLVHFVRVLQLRQRLQTIILSGAALQIAPTSYCVFTRLALWLDSTPVLSCSTVRSRVGSTTWAVSWYTLWQFRFSRRWQCTPFRLKRRRHLHPCSRVRCLHEFRKMNGYGETHTRWLYFIIAKIRVEQRQSFRTWNTHSDTA